MAKKIKYEFFKPETKGQNQQEVKEHIVRNMGVMTNYRNDFGRAHGTIACPFCHHKQTAYVWSMAGGGKRCEHCNIMMTCAHAVVTKIEYNKWVELEKLKAS